MGFLRSWGSKRAATFIYVLPTLAIALHAETVQEIAGAVVFARGGQTKIASVQTERLSGRILTADREGSFVLELKRPNKIRMEIVLDGASVVQSSDGHTGWKLDPLSSGTAPRKMSDAEAKELAANLDLDEPFIDFERKGTSIEIVDTELLGPSLVWRLKLTLKSGAIEYYFVETTGHFVLARERTLGDKGAETRFYDDFRRVQGLLFPFAITSMASPGVFKFQVEKLDIDIPIDDAEFTMPAKASK